MSFDENLDVIDLKRLLQLQKERFNDDRYINVRNYLKQKIHDM